MTKQAVTRFPIHDLLGRRWSPRSFLDRSVPEEAVGQLLEAARWAPSCYNEQPWRFFVARREEAALHERLAGLLVPGNRAWAGRAPLLMLSVARLTFTHNDKPNRHAYHDVGLAVGSMLVQAESIGLSAHQMAGFDAERARTELSIPAGHDPVAMIAFGYRGAPDLLPDELRKREEAPRQRRDLAELAFGETWGATHAGLSD